MPEIREWELTVNEAKELAKTQTHEDPSMFLWGPPGIGKTSIVAQAAQEIGVNYVKFDAAMRDPTDIRGVLFVVDGKARYLPPDDLPEVTRDGQKGILFCDEILFAVPAVQNNLHSLILERKVGNYKFPENWVIIAASNREDDRAQIYELSGPLANRFMHINCIADYDGWALNWAVKNEIDPLIISYLKLHPDHFCQLPDALTTFATPRSWEFANRYLAKGLPEKLERAAIAGCVGQGIEIELHAHKSLGVEAEKIIDDIVSGNYPNFKQLKVSMLWVVNIYLATNLLKKFNQFASPLCNYTLKVGDFHPEMAIHTAKLAVTTSGGKIIKEPDWLRIAQKYGDLLLS